MRARTDRYRWVVLAVGAGAQGVNAMVFLGLASISPQLREHFDLSVPQVGLLLGMVSLGTMLALVGWGAAADRFGERGVMVVGLLGSAAFIGAAGLCPTAVGAGLALAGCGVMGGSVNAASGRAVMTWFDSGRRGFAMAVRQTATPIGAALAALGLPAIAIAAGTPAAFYALAGVSLAMAGAVGAWVREPPGAVRGRKDHAKAADVLRDHRLLRLSLASGLLVVPQFTASALMVELLHDHRGIAIGAAATLLAVAQVLGGAGRLAAGLWSDAVRSRLRPLRVIAVAIGAGFGLSAALDSAPAWLLCAVLLPSAGLAICWNGLAFTAAGEMAPDGRSGTALGMQNTANYLAAAITPAAAGWVAEQVAWPAMLLLAAASALAARLVLRNLREGRPESVVPLARG